MKKILLGFALLLVALSMSAIPAKPGPIRVTQPDGSVITIYRHGDEFGHWITDAQGRVVRKGADGFYRPVPGVTAETARHQAAVRRQALRRDHHFHAPSVPIAFDQKHFLVILVAFSDLDFATADPNLAFSNLMNQQGYSANGGKGSARDFYYENSKGKFEPIFDVYGPVKLTHDMAYYGGNDSNGDDQRPEQAVAEACEALDGEIDFSRYDNDGDGTVDLVFMYYAGNGEADSDDEDAIWPHQWALSDADIDLTLDGCKVDNYACSNELEGMGSYAGKMCGIGTACHEFGHAMGLPDFYDTDYDTNGIAAGPFDFSLMAGGAYNGEGRVPPYLGIEERILLGWIDESALQELSTSGEYTLSPVQENKAFKTLTDADGEYFVYECRGESGWDSALPAHGLLVYHVDKSAHKVRIEDYGQIPASELWSDWDQTNAINENGSHPCYYVVAAVDQGNLKYGYEYLSDYGASYFDPYYEGLAANIPFPGAKNITTYTAKSWSGAASSISLSNIAYSGGQVSFTAKLPSAGLDYYSIQNPGNGSYEAGSSFTLALDAPEGGSYSGVKWYFDDREVTGTSVSLTAGSHTVEAEITLSGGKKQIVTLEIKVP